MSAITNQVGLVSDNQGRKHSISPAGNGHEDKRRKKDDEKDEAENNEGNDVSSESFQSLTDDGDSSGGYASEPPVIALDDEGDSSIMKTLEDAEGTRSYLASQEMLMSARMASLGTIKELLSAWCSVCPREVKDNDELDGKPRYIVLRELLPKLEELEHSGQDDATAAMRSIHLLTTLYSNLNTWKNASQAQVVSVIDECMSTEMVRVEWTDVPAYPKENSDLHGKFASLHKLTPHGQQNLHDFSAKYT